ncbi:MAG: peptidylprolyl isomerase [Clostridia bacterium]|nr:peptidylprolyl isomerase [Clostridia bacterium]
MKQIRRLTALILALLLALSLAACSSSPFKNPIAKLGDVKIPSEEFYYYYSSLVSSFEQQHGAAFSTFSGTKMDEESGTYLDEIVNYALDLTATQAVINHIFDERGLSLTEEDDAIVQEQIDDYISAYGSEEAFEQAVAETGMSMDFFKENLYSYQRIDRLIESMHEEEGYTDADILAAAEEDFIRVKHILIQTRDEAGELLDEAGIAEAGDRAKALVAQLDEGADFDALMAEYGEDPGMVSQPEGYVIDEDVPFDVAFVDTAFSLDVDEYELVLGSSGYHIIKRFPLRESDLQAIYPSLYGGSKTVYDTIFETRAENKIIDMVNSYKKDNELKLDQKELDVLMQYYEKQNPFVAESAEGEEQGETGAETDAGSDSSGS